MKVWIVYDIERLKKNIRFAELLLIACSKRGAEAKVVILKEKGKETISLNIADLKFPASYLEFLLLDGETISLLREEEFPNIVIMRTFNVRMSKFFENKKVKVCNGSLISELFNDKWLSYEYAKNRNIDIMPVSLFSNNDLIQEEIIFPKVLKSKFGHGGNEVFLVEDLESLKKAQAEISEETLVLQDVASERGKDLRVYIIGNKIIVSMLRESKTSFKSNYSLGGTAKEYTLDKQGKNIVEKFLKDFHFDFAGIDFIFNKGKYIFNEVEDVVGCRMVYENTDIDLADLYIDYLLQDETI